MLTQHTRNEVSIILHHVLIHNRH